MYVRSITCHGASEGLPWQESAARTTAPPPPPPPANTPFTHWARLCTFQSKVRPERHSDTGTRDAVLHEKGSIAHAPSAAREAPKEDTKDLVAAYSTVKGDTMAAAALLVYTKQPRSPFCFCIPFSSITFDCVLPCQSRASLL